MIRKLLAILIYLLFLTGNSSAEVIYLKSGKVVDGEIIEKTEEYIKVNYNGVNLTYWLDEIERIGNQNNSTKISDPVPVKDGKSVYYDKEHGLRISIPEGWIVIDKNNPQQFAEETNGNTAGIICMFKESSAVHVPWICINSNFPSKDYTIEDYTEVLRERNLQRQENFPGLEIIENCNLINLGGNKCSKAITKLGNEIGVYYNFLNGKICYSVIGSSPADKFEAYKDIFEKTAASLQFEDIKTDHMELADAEQLNILGSQYFSTGQFDKAIEIHEKALVKASTPELKTKILTMLSSSYLEKGITSYLADKDGADYKKAIDYAEQALKISPNYWLALGNIAVVYMNKGDLEKADFYFDEAGKYADRNNPGYQQLISTHTLVKKTLDTRKK